LKRIGADEETQSLAMVSLAQTLGKWCQ
jgi:hypothetical protein